ncbi:hypothetical protein HKX48_008548 [Thoreauomyces humboldtii]|nr:hypothetical protein HKX48_008548 [Thoreauomyces humboldtii]
MYKARTASIVPGDQPDPSLEAEAADESDGDDAVSATLSDVTAAALNLIHRFLVGLGDLARYRELYAFQDHPGQWHVAQGYYRRAMRINPDIGKPYSQLAILASYSSQDNIFGVFPVTDEVEVVYWYCLRLAFQLEDASASNIHKPYGNLIMGISPLLTSKVNAPTTTALTIWLGMVVPVLIATHQDLGQRFEQTELPTSRQAIRILQVYLTALLLHLLATGLELAVGVLADPLFDPEALDDMLDERLAWLPICGLVAVWLEMNSEPIFKIWGTYVGTFSESLEVLQPTLLRACHSLSAFANFASSFADMDGMAECLAEDVDLLGLVPLRAYYGKLSSASLRAVLHNASDVQADNAGKPATTTASTGGTHVRVARIAALANHLATQPEPDAFRFDDATGRYVVLDRDAKKKDQHKLSKALATELLRSQVSTLQSHLTRLDALQQRLPTCVLPASVYVDHTPRVRRWIGSGRCVVVLPLEVIDHLDLLKKGNERRNARAREVMRFLDQRFRFRSRFLVAQPRTDDAGGEEGLVGCLEAWVKKGHCWFVSEDEEAREEARRVGAVGVGVEEWEEVLRSKSGGGGDGMGRRRE